MNVWWDEGAEKSLIGAVLLRPEIAETLDVATEDFFDPSHREIWAAIRTLRDELKPIDVVTLELELNRRWAMKLVESGKGGALPHTVHPAFTVMPSCVSTVPTADNADFYAATVVDFALKRRVVDVLGGVLARRDLSGEQILATAWEAVSKLESRRTDAGVAMPEIVRKVFEALGRAVDEKSRSSIGVPTGFPDLDAKIGGLLLGAVTIIAARPSVGKSSLARCIAGHVTLAGDGVHVFSLEDRHDAYGLRALADQTEISLQRLRVADVDRREMSEIISAMDVLHRRSNWFIDDTPGLSSAQMAVRVRRRKRDLRTKVVVVDYVTLMNEGGRDEEENVTRAARGLARLAREEAVAVLLVSQLNRESEKRPDKRPILADLRQSGELEQIADVVLMLYRHEMHHPREQIGQAEVLIRKNKSGPLGMVPLHWNGDAASFRSVAKYERQLPFESPARAMGGD